jgi:sec-independent protein translocase protein TatB
VFDVGFVELMVIGVVALLVLGPDRLPGAARTVGAFVRRARNSWNSVRSEIEREIAAEEMKKSLADGVKSFDIASELRREAAGIRRELDGASAAANVPPAPAQRSDRPPHD